MNVYVAGPVVDLTTGRGAEWLAVYDEIAANYGSQGHEVVLPYRDSADNLSPPDFFQEISRRIGDADQIVAVLASGDQSVPIEIAIAVALQREVVVLHPEQISVPRLLAGLPGVSIQAL